MPPIPDKEIPEIPKIIKSCADKIILVIILLLWSVGPVCGAAPYKIYTIIRHGDRDIVCDSYVVRKGDHVWELLRRKGTIAEHDFPQFVSILKRLNPHIKDVDKIYPRQQILIPLKQTGAGEQPPDARPRYITIPIIPDVLYVTYEVRPGECLSKIVNTHLGCQWDELSEDYVQTLMRLNPAVKNLDLIYPGQPIRIPEVPATVPTRTAATPTVVAASGLKDRGRTRRQVVDFGAMLLSGKGSGGRLSGSYDLSGHRDGRRTTSDSEVAERIP